MTPEKVCTGCKVVKPVGQFGADRDKRDGLTSRCRACLSIRNATARGHTVRGRNPQHMTFMAAKRIGVTLTEYLAKVELGEKWCTGCKAWHPLSAFWRLASKCRVFMVRSPSTRARRAVLRAVRTGRLQKPEACEECGKPQTRIQAAHYDYARVLDVRWLCASCHAKWDHKDPKLHWSPAA